MSKLSKAGISAIAYTRVSTLEQSRFGISLDAQDERLRAYCLMSQLDLVRIVREEGVSGSIPLGRRPGGAGLLQEVRSGVTHVVALKLDRLFRDAEDALRQTREWDKAGISLHLVDMGGQSMNTGSAMGRMLLTVMSGFAELERNLIGERTALALSHKRAHHLVFNHTPYGFMRVGDALVEADVERGVIRLMRERRDDGWSLQMIASALNEDRIAGKQGGRWHARTVKNILDSDIYDLPDPGVLQMP